MQSIGFLSVLGIILAAICATLVVVVIVQIVKTNRLKERLDKFLIGQDGSDLEAAILDKWTKMKVLEEKDAAEDRAIRDLYGKLKNTYQRLGIVRYDAHMENGGKLSFVMALLDEEGNGIIMNVMNSSDGSYCYLKEIENGRCDTGLGNEEAQALDIAMYAK